MRLTTFESRLKPREQAERLPATEREFVIRYVFLRASMRTDSIDAAAAAKSARDAWFHIKRCDN